MSTMILALASVLATAPTDTTLRIAQGTVVEINSMAGNVTVRTASGDQVTVRGASVEMSGRRLEVGSDDFMRPSSTPIIVTVPTWATVVVDAMNANITVEQAPERLTAETLNGRIEVRGGRGVLDLSTMAGAITVRDFAGTRLTAEAVSGAITVDGATGNVTVTSVSQAIVLRNVRSSQVTAETTNGRINWEGALAATGRYNFATHNGEILLALPENTSARIRGSMFNGSFESALEATTTGLEGSRRNRAMMLGRDFTATLGGGSANVEVETFNGSIRVVRMGST